MKKFTILQSLHPEGPNRLCAIKLDNIFFVEELIGLDCLEVHFSESGKIFSIKVEKPLFELIKESENV